MSASIGLLNQDQSFFTISSPDMNLSTDIKQDDVRALTIVETMNRMDTGTLELNDPYDVYSRIIRFGVRLDVTWGYKSWSERIQQRFTAPQTFDKATQNITRTGLRLFCSTPSGEGTEQGEKTYRVQLVAMDMRGAQKQRRFTSGTRGSIVKQVMTEIGVAAPIIAFTTQTTAVDDQTAITQWESDFAFLARMAYEWDAYFKISHDRQGNLVGIFVDPSTIRQLGFLNSVGGVGGPESYKLEYHGGLSNVMSFNWQSHMGESGAGDGTSYAWVNGQVVMYRYVVQNEKVTSWRLNTERIRAYLEAQNEAAGPGAVAKAAKDALSTRDFSSVVGTLNGKQVTVRYFFDKVVGNTAPQGYGVTINVRMPGTPMLIPSMPMALGHGFPDKLGRNLPYNPYGNDVNFFLRNHTHTINSSGYLSELSIVDAFTAFTQNQSRY